MEKIGDSYFVRSSLRVVVYKPAEVNMELLCSLMRDERWEDSRMLLFLPSHLTRHIEWIIKLWTFLSNIRTILKCFWKILYRTSNVIWLKSNKVLVLEISKKKESGISLPIYNIFCFLTYMCHSKTNSSFMALNFNTQNRYKKEKKR